MDVAVFAGGRSPEHDISVCSAQKVLQHLDGRKWRAWPVYLDREGVFWTRREPLAAGSPWDPTDPRGAVAMRPGAALDFLLDHSHVQVIFPVLHGPFGEDGTIQGMLELYDVPFVGSGCAASALAMDKLRTRQILDAIRVPQANAYQSAVPARALTEHLDAEFARMTARLGLPCFAKVDCSGSSRGVQRIADREDFSLFAEAARSSPGRWLAEAAVPGEEITVAVLGNRDQVLQPLPAVGIYPRFAEHFDERAKYEPGACDEVVPPRGLEPAQLRRAEELALACHRELGCDGMSRTDMIWSSAGPVVLEVNTIPGLTETSLLPRAAAAAGLTFGALLDRLLELALQRSGQLVA